MAKYFKKLDNKYLVSGPAPLGRILNYIKRVKLGEYETLMRGPRSTKNLDDWTVSFMVGLGLIRKPVYSPDLKLTLTKNGEKIYRMIKTLPKFPDNLRRARVDMIKNKDDLISKNPKLYNLLRDILLKSDSMKNFALFLRSKGKKKIRKKEFKEYGEIFGITEAWFNRVPSSWQTAEFCGIIEESRKFIRVYDSAYVEALSVSDIREVTQNMIKEDLKEIKSKRKKELDEDEENFLKDIPPNITPQRKKTILDIIQRNSRIAKKLKKLYNGKCQICGFTFKKKDGENYSEANHLIPLGEHGSDSVCNLTILCANCHRELTYAEVKLGELRDNKRFVILNGVRKEIKYHPLHFKAIRESDITI